MEDLVYLTDILRMTMDRTAIVQKRRTLAMIIATGVVVAVVGIAAIIGGLSGAAPEQAGLAPSPAPVDAPTSDPALTQRVLDSARQYLNQQKPQQAEIVLSKGIEQAPEDQDLRIAYAETLLTLGRTREAYDQYEKAIYIGPDPADLHFTAGTVANAAGLTDRSIEHFSMAQQKDASNPNYPLNLAQIQRKIGDLDAAKASLLRAIRLDPTLAIAHGVLADIALQENSLSLARQYIDRARDLQPASVHWRLIEARIDRRENHPEDALRLILALDESTLLSDRMLLTEAGLCYGMLRKPDEAADLFSRAAERNPEDADLLYETALWHQRAGLDDAAAVYASRAARLGNAAAERLLASIEDSAG
jgi:type IV pilus assembly protein PilF